MCTIVIAWRQFDDVPIAVAANRDEATDRPSTGPALREGEPRVLAPRDERAGGTWMGVNEHGLFAIVANRWTDADLAGERSRGLLTGDVLASESVASATALLRAETADREYEGFTMVVADGSDARVVEWDGTVSDRSLSPGVHVVVNVGVDGEYDVPTHRWEIGERQARNADRIREAVEPTSSEGVEQWLDRASDVLADHDYGACIHQDRYGTVSSSQVAVGADGAVDWLYADGPPCTTAFRRVDGQI